MSRGSAPTGDASPLFCSGWKNRGERIRTSDLLTPSIVQGSAMNRC